MPSFRSDNRKVLVTGANGFVGRALVSGLIQSGMAVRACVRHQAQIPPWPPVVDTVRVPTIDRHTDWTPHLQDIGCVVHLAAKAHVVSGAAASDLRQYEEINVKAAEALMTACRSHNIVRFIFISTVKVHGDGIDCAYRETDHLDPQDIYSQTKCQAEEAIRKNAAEGETEWVILRPPLVYGPGVKANFLTLLKLVDLNLPMPMAGLIQRRSMIYVENLVDAITHCIASPKAAGQIFLVSDDFDLTVADLLKEIAGAMGRNPRLFPFPPQYLERIFKMAGRGAVAKKLTRPLTVDITKIKTRIGWQPPISIRDGISATVKWFKSGSL